MIASLHLRWKLLAALARFGALRSPSESLLLRWEDVLLDQECPCLFVKSPKTESQGKPWRKVPVSPRLAEILREARPVTGDLTDYVVDLPSYSEPRTNGWHGVTTRQQFNRILEKAKIKVIKNAFKVFRSSCVTDWAKNHPVHVVAAWAGHIITVVW